MGPRKLQASGVHGFVWCQERKGFDSHRSFGGRGRKGLLSRKKRPLQARKKRPWQPKKKRLR